MVATWEVDIFVSGPIIVKGRRIQLNQPKGFRFEDPFYSNVEISSFGSSGIKATVTAFASTNRLAREAAIYFFAQMLDVLALQIQLPLDLSLFESGANRQSNRLAEHRSSRFTERRLIQRDEWRWAFRESRLLAFSEPAFLRSTSWYRKGLIAEDPFDKFLAFWNAIEVIAAKYHPKTERTKNGSKSQIWECFKAIWGECKEWPIITGEQNWIDENYNVRKAIAHGLMPVDIETVKSVLDKLEKIERVAWLFLTEWRKKELQIEVPPALADLFQIELPEVTSP